MDLINLSFLVHKVTLLKIIGSFGLLMMTPVLIPKVIDWINDKISKINFEEVSLLYSQILTTLKYINKRIYGLIVSLFLIFIFCLLLFGHFLNDLDPKSREELIYRIIPENYIVYLRYIYNYPLSFPLSGLSPIFNFFILLGIYLVVIRLYVFILEIVYGYKDPPQIFNIIEKIILLPITGIPLLVILLLFSPFLILSFMMIVVLFVILNILKLISQYNFKEISVTIGFILTIIYMWLS